MYGRVNTSFLYFLLQTLFQTSLYTFLTYFNEPITQPLSRSRVVFLLENAQNISASQSKVKTRKQGAKKNYTIVVAFIDVVFVQVFIWFESQKIVKKNVNKQDLISGCLLNCQVLFLLSSPLEGIKISLKYLYLFPGQHCDTAVCLLQLCI